MTTLLDTQVFLFSSAEPPPDHYFQGYCFTGSDYVFGPEGADEYRRQTGQTVGPGEDGCYVSAYRDGAEFVFGTDFSGNKKLYYYSDLGFWAVSNSLSRMIAHLGSHGIKVSPNRVQLAAAGSGQSSSALNQLSSFDTIAHGIRLLPIKTQLAIGPRAVGWRPVPARPAKSYADALAEHVGTWVERLATLLSVPGLSVSSDLTGGIDSRVVLALLLRARHYLGDVRANLRFGSAPTRGETTDIEIATEICESYGLQLNTPRPPSPHRFTPQESYLSWRQLCLGTYHPIYFPGMAPFSHRVALGGGGGENHRRFYKEGSPEQFIRNRTTRIRPESMQEPFATSVRNVFRTLEFIEGPEADPLIAHYRHFRNRLHSGRTPQYSVQFMPLGSSLLEDAAVAGGPDRIDRAQLNYDILASTVPELLDVRFDQDYKAPSQEVRAAITRVEAGFSGAGRVYHGPPLALGTRPTRGSVWQLLAEELEEAAQSPVVRDLWPATFVASARQTARDAVENKRLPHPTQGQPIAAILASTMF